MPVLNRIAGFAEDITAWRHHLHSHPELALDCHDTAAFVVDRLRDFGVDEIHEGIAKTGVVAIIRGRGEGPVTGLRADMDALPMQEATGLPYASTIPGRMHACGHDGHTAMLLGAARYLAETRNFRGTAVLIFQPAEETIGGGRLMVEAGMMDRFGVEEVYALHTDPFADAGVIRTKTGGILAAVDDFSVTITGQGGHAAYPSLCRDPIPCVLALGQSLMSIPARNVPALSPLVLSVTQVHAGTAFNIIPEEAHLTGTVRSYDPDLRDAVEARIRACVAGVAATYQVTAALDYDRGYPATVNHPAQTQRAIQSAQSVVGQANVVTDLDPEMGAEDFSYMLQARPGAFLFLGQGIGPSVHHPEFDFNDEVAPIGASFFATLIEQRGADSTA